MSITLTTNYQEVLAADTVEKIQELLDEQHDLECMLEFIDENNESDFVAYYEEYVRCGENLGYDVVDKFIEEFGLDCVESCEEAYHGEYNSSAEFAEQFISDCYGEVSPLVVVDWTATYEQNLYYDYAYVDGYVFNKNF